MKTPDAELLLLFVRRRSEPAFRTIVERHKGLVFSICCRKLGDPHLAEDATQKVFVTLALKAAELEPGPLPGFLAKTAMYISTDMGLARAARARHERQYGNMKQRSDQATEPPDERSLRLQQVLAQLRRRYREPVQLRYFDGLSIDAVGAALDLSPEAVKKRLVRALAHLRARMAAQGFTMSLAVAAGMLRRLPVPSPPMDLTGRIVEAIFRSPPAPCRVGASRKLLVHLGTGIAGATTIAAVVMVALFPRSRPIAAAPNPPLIRITPAVPNGGVAPGAALDFNRRLARKLPGLLNRPARFDFALTSLSAMSDIPIEPRWQDIEALGVHRGTEFTEDLRDKNVLQDLDAILERVAPGTLECVAADGRIIVQPRDKRSDVQKTATIASR
ncbi:MAG TPA: sigma-70 family RNA polymerase sigma factor [Tepidisphaeraceae bacterium]|jgi:RNA polymerase sigma factor (sigma-70 family)|nr:sigma-70 family RNA polymerase sigma factor [Tepidisphaeraceae bacterium]